MPKRCLLRLAGVLMLGFFSAIAADGSAQDVGPPVKLTPGEAEEAVDEPAQSILAAEGEGETSAAGADESAVQIATLDAVDPSSIGLLDESEGGFGIDMWLGTERALVERLLPRMPVGTLSRPMQDLARRLLLSTARVPAGDAIAPSLLGLRVERLSAGGDTVAVNELLRLAPARLQDRAFARARIDGQLLAGNHAEACAAYKALVGEDPDNLYWLKGLTFCKALNGDHAAVRFAVDLLHEIGQDEDTAFLSLIASLSGDAEARVASLVDPLPLHLAMLQVARLPVPANAVPGAPPAILRAIAKAPNAALDVRLAAAERAEAAGALSAEALAEIYKGVLFTPSEISAARSLAREEPGPRANALLYQAGQIQRIPVLRAQALQLAWQLGHEQGRFGTAARVNREATLDIEPAPDLAWFAADAVRALLAAGEAEAAFRWFRFAQQMATPSEPEAAMAVLEVWPLMFLAKPSLGKGWNPEITLLWWAALGEMAVPNEARHARAALVFTLLEAFDLELPDAAWSSLMDSSLTETAYVPSTPLWRNLGAASRGGRTGETVLLSLLVLGEGGPTGAHPRILAEVIGALRAVGLEQEARGLALEAALAMPL